MDGGDIISSMPDEILHHILSFIPTDSTIRTSLLSRRWRHVWSEAPSLYLKTTVQRINQTLISYKAPKITSFHLRITRDQTVPQIDSWIEFAISRNVQKLSLNFTYSFPNFFNLSEYIVPSCSVSWKSLRNLSLFRCNLPEESISNILSRSPNLQSLTLYYCGGLLQHLDLSKSLSLTRLEIVRDLVTGPIEIVAPHIHYLRLRNTCKPCTLVDVSSLTEAKLDIYIRNVSFEDVTFQTMVVPEMLAKFQNVERLTVGPTLLQILSLAELRGFPLQMLNVQTLIVETMVVRSTIPGIARLLQNSPGLKKLIVHIVHKQSRDNTIRDEHLDSYLDSRGLNPDQCWRSKYNVFPTSQEFFSMLQPHDAMLKLLASFLKLVMRNAKTLERMVVWLGSIYFDDAKWFEEQLQIVRTLSHDNNVSIELN